MTRQFVPRAPIARIVLFWAVFGVGTCCIIVTLARSSLRIVASTPDTPSSADLDRIARERDHAVADLAKLRRDVADLIRSNEQKKEELLLATERQTALSKNIAKLEAENDDVTKAFVMLKRTTEKELAQSRRDGANLRTQLKSLESKLKGRDRILELLDVESLEAAVDPIAEMKRTAAAKTGSANPKPYPVVGTYYDERGTRPQLLFVQTYVLASGASNFELELTMGRWKAYATSADVKHQRLTFVGEFDVPLSPKVKHISLPIKDLIRLPEDKRTLSVYGDFEELKKDAPQALLFPYGKTP